MTFRLARRSTVILVALVAVAACAPVAGAATISGHVQRVSGEPLENVCVGVTLLSPGDADRFARTNAAGDYAVTGLGAGAYAVRFSPCEGGTYRAEYWNDRVSFGDPIQLTADEVRSGIDAALADAGEIRGRVTGPGGEGVPSVCIKVYDASAQAGYDQFTGVIASGEVLSRSGDYVLGGLANGHRKVVFEDCGSGLRLARSFYDGRSDLGSADVLDIDDRQTRSGIDVQMVAGGAIAGRVTDPVDLPAQGVCVAAQLPASGAPVAGALTAADGTYTLAGLAPGTYAVTFLTTGCPFATPADFAPQWFSGRLRRTFADPVGVVAGQTTQNVDARMTPPDTEPPDTTILSGPGATTTEGTATFAFSATEAGAEFECRLDAGAWSPCSSPASYTGLAAGVHAFAVRATDPSGNVDPEPATWAWLISTPSPGGGSSSASSSSSTQSSSSAPALVPPSTLPAVTTSPAITRLTLTPTTFRAAARGPSITAARARPPIGTRITYRDSARATTTFTVRRPSVGVRRGGRCVRPGRASRRAKRCTRWIVLAGSFRHTDTTGANTLRFSGRLAGRALAPGRYRLVATPALGAVRGRSTSTAFTIAR